MRRADIAEALRCTFDACPRHTRRSLRTTCAPPVGHDPGMPPPRVQPHRSVAFRSGDRLALHLVNVGELFAEIASLAGSREAGSGGNGIAQSRLVSGVEYARATRSDERKLRSSWRERKGGGPTPLVLVVDDPDEAGIVRVLGPQEGGPIRRIRAQAMLELVRRTATMKPLEAVRHVAQEVERLDTEGVAGLTVRGLGTEHLYGTRLPASPRWGELTQLSQGLAHLDWKDFLTRLGYGLEQLSRHGYLVKLRQRTVAVVHPRASAGHFARLDAEGRLPEGALLADCVAHGADFGILAAGTRLRVLATGKEEAGAATRYLDLDTATLEPERLPLLGLLAPPYLADGGLAAVLDEARDYGRKLRLRLDRVLRQDVLPVLGRELGRWAQGEGHDLANDRVREELEAAALTFVFRALFLLYAESAGHLPMSNHTYAQRSLTRVAERAAEEADRADPASTSLWRDITGLIEAMRNGQVTWGVPAYNGALFAADGFAGARVLDRAVIGDAALAPALVALARDGDDPTVGVDFSGLEIGHLGHIYEGLLSLRLSVADRDYAYDERSDRYGPADATTADVHAGDLLWLTNEGGRKGGGVYYTRTELVRHLVRGAVGPAFDRHLAAVRELAAKDPAAAADHLFDFHVLDPACGSAHFLVEVVDELADKIARLLGELALPAVRGQLDSLRAGAGASFGAGIEDTALLKRLVLKRCVYGVDVSPMGAEIAKVSLWLGSFVPGLSLAYLDHNVQVGNSLIGVARAEAITPPQQMGGEVTLFGDSISEAVVAAARSAAELRAIEDRTPTEVARSQEIDEALHHQVAGVRRVFDLWTAEAIDPKGFKGARDEALRHGDEIIAGRESPLAGRAGALSDDERLLHWPLAFAEVFGRPNPGFDAVVGNPPWEEVTVEELGFYARYMPGLRALPEKERRAALADLRERRPDLPQALEAEQQRMKTLRRYFGAQSGYANSAGDPDTYKLFCQRYRQVLRDGGSLGVVLPRTAFQAKGSRGFREWLLSSQTSLLRIDFLVNRGRWAFDITDKYTVALLLAEARPSSSKAFILGGVAASPSDFLKQVGNGGISVDRGALGPSLELPLLSAPAEAKLLAKLRSGSPLTLGAGRWRCFPATDFHETHDKDLWENAASGWPLWKGESFAQYAPTGANARPCPPTEDAIARAVGIRPGKDSLLADTLSAADRRQIVAESVGRERVAFRDVSRGTDPRTIIACLVPPGTFLTNKAPYLAFEDREPLAQAACLALLNSLVLDWQARRFVEINLNFFILEGLRIPDLAEPVFRELGRSAARLSAVDDRFAAFAQACDVDCGPLETADEQHLRARIDALVARAANVTLPEFDLLLSDFSPSSVPEDYRVLVRSALSNLSTSGTR